MELEYGARCDDCHRIFAVDELVRVHDRFLCGECEEHMRVEMEGDRMIAEEDERIFLMAYERSQGFY